MTVGYFALVFRALYLWLSPFHLVSSKSIILFGHSLFDVFVALFGAGLVLWGCVRLARMSNVGSRLRLWRQAPKPGFDRPEAFPEAGPLRTWPLAALAAVVALAVFYNAQGALEGFARRHAFWKDPLPRFEAEECWFGELPARNARCGYLVVAENRREFSTAEVRLPVVLLEPRGGPKHLDPVVYLAGGPGSPTGLDEDSLKEWAAYFPSIPAVSQRSVILMDQRATGLSEPSLDCPSFSDWPRYLDTLFVPRTVGACRSRHTKAGVDLTQYTTEAIVEDFIDLRVSVAGGLRWNVWGKSYGTLLALELLRHDGEGVRSALLDGVYPSRFANGLDGLSNRVAAFDRLLDACDTDPACSAAFPALSQQLSALRAELRDVPARIFVKLDRFNQPIRFTIDDSFMLDLLYAALYFTESVQVLPFLIDAAASGHHQAFQKLLPIWDWLKLDPQFGHVLHWSLECGDNVPLEDGVYTQGQGSLRMAYESIPDWTREWMLRAPIAGICDAWGIKRKSTLSAEFVRSDAPVLLLSGALDPVTPPSYAEAALDYLPNGHHFVFPGRAHDVGADPCARRLMSEFLAEPGTRPTDACFEGLGPMEFLTSVD